MSSDLAWTPPGCKQFADHLSQLDVAVHPSAMASGTALHGLTVRIERPISALWELISPKFPADRRRCPAEGLRYFPYAQPRSMQVADRDPFLL